MITVNINEAKTHLSEYLKKGEIVVICKRNVPIAEIHPYKKLSKKPRPLGLAKDTFDIPSEFFEDLPEEIIKKFEGE